MTCSGCREAWRLDGWRHRAGKGECVAKPIRQELREIAREARQRSLGAIS
jgi:hypothetical protein